MVGKNTVMNHIEFIVTLRCKSCGDIVSLELPLTFEKAQESIKEFTEKHEHSSNPWII